MVRRLGPGDGAALREIAVRFKGAAAPPDAAERFLADVRNLVLVAEGGAGFLLAYELPRIDGHDTMVFLYEIGVAEEHRRRGVGRALVAELHRQTPHARKTFVLTDDRWPDAAPFYAALGAERAERDQLLFTWRREDG